MDKRTIILYLGDHDPSGEDMVRDIATRLTMFGAINLSVTKVALTIEQVRRYSPPPNPAKMSDSRASGYIDRFGSKCWEVDALPPEILSRLIRQAMEEYIDDELMEKVKAREERDKRLLLRSVRTLTKPTKRK